jgi:hypothetical protein
MATLPAKVFKVIYPPVNLSHWLPQTYDSSPVHRRLNTPTAPVVSRVRRGKETENGCWMDEVVGCGALGSWGDSMGVGACDGCSSA